MNTKDSTESTQTICVGALESTRVNTLVHRQRLEDLEWGLWGGWSWEAGRLGETKQSGKGTPLGVKAFPWVRLPLGHGSER